MGSEEGISKRGFQEGLSGNQGSERKKGEL